MKIITIVGARPQFIKASVVSREIEKHDDINEIIVHTGQHYDKNMSDIFFDEMKIPKPDYNLNINGLGHGAMTGQMLYKIEEVLLNEKPDWVIVYGDTNSTLAGALAAKKINIRVAHVEAGLRSLDMTMPEEINRILTDRISDLLLCPTDTAINNLNKEGFSNFNCKVENTGDVMYDAIRFYSKLVTERSVENTIKKRISITSKYILLTLHRAENTDNVDRLINIFTALKNLNDLLIVFPVHPRTMKVLKSIGLKLNSNIITIDPVSYFDMIELESNCEFIMTDSGGVQKEAYFLKKPCITLRDSTEWVETLETGANRLVGSDINKIIYALENINYPSQWPNHYGDGNAGSKIIKFLL